MEGADQADAQARRRNASIALSHDNNNQEESDYDSDSSSDLPLTNEPKKSRKPGNNAFRQQRLRSFNPVFTASTVIPILIAIAIIFIPLGGGMWYAAHTTQDLKIEYTHCENMASSNYWSEIPSEYVHYRFKNSLGLQYKAQWRLSTDDSQLYEDERNVCHIQFEIPQELSAPIYFFYRLENFYANHRRYSNSFSEDQIEGKASSLDTIKNTAGQNCKPLSDDNGKKYYPCGLIANSMFNDTFETSLMGVNNTAKDYEMTEKGIAWATNSNRFKKTKYNYTEITPPPYWVKKFPNGYNETNVPDISQWPQFQNWMQASGLPNFNKMALRNDDDPLPAGVYEVTIGLHFPVLPYKGRKYIFISQRSVIGGKNYFLGISWIAGGGVCFVLGLVLLAINMVKPRKTGDVNLLSWNREQFEKDEQEEPVN